MGKEEFAEYQHVSCFRVVFTRVVCRDKYMRGCWNGKELMKKVVLLHNKKSSLLLYVFLLLAHLSTTCSGGAIVTGHRPASVRPSVRPSVHPLTISLKIFSSKIRRPILIKLGRNVPWVKLYKIVKRI